MNLQTYQAHFHAALWAELPSGPLCALTSQAGFKVYRNTVVKGCVDALAANYPAVCALVGEEWFRAAAACHVRETPPSLPMLMEYGARFADFLARFPPAAALPYLSGVARIDRHWTEAHLASDAPCADAAELACRAPAQLGALCLRPHPAARWTWCAEAPVFSLWEMNRGQTAMPPRGLADIAWRGEGALTTRPCDAVRVTAIPAAACVLLDACARGATLAAAASAALAGTPELDLAALIAQLLTAGAFAHPDSLTQPLELHSCPLR